jgi:hypothetical protein
MMAFSLPNGSSSNCKDGRHYTSNRTEEVVEATLQLPGMRQGYDGNDCLCSSSSPRKSAQVANFSTVAFIVHTSSTGHDVVNTIFILHSHIISL